MGVYLLNSRTERRFWWVRPRFNDRIHKALTRPQVRTSSQGRLQARSNQIGGRCSGVYRIGNLREFPHISRASLRIRVVEWIRAYLK
ncbi:hypothetical protein OROGR_033324 [Orobanche gracilis]